MPPPATRRPRASSTPRRFPPPISFPAFFHAGSTLELRASRGFPSPVASHVSRRDLPLVPFDIDRAPSSARTNGGADLGFRGSSIRRVRSRRAGVTRCPSSRSSPSVDLSEVFPTRPRPRASTRPPLLGFRHDATLGRSEKCPRMSSRSLFKVSKNRGDDRSLSRSTDLHEVCVLFRPPACGRRSMSDAPLGPVFVD
jgi:hypothetical protein